MKLVVIKKNFFVRNLYGVDESLSYYVFDHTYLLDSLIDELDAVNKLNNSELYKLEKELKDLEISISKNEVNIPAFARDITLTSGSNTWHNSNINIFKEK